MIRSTTPDVEGWDPRIPTLFGSIGIKHIGMEHIGMEHIGMEHEHK